MKNDETNDQFDDDDEELEEEEEQQSESSASDIVDDIKQRAKKKLEDKIKDKIKEKLEDRGEQNVENNDNSSSNQPENNKDTNTSQEVNEKGDSKNASDSGNSNNTSEPKESGNGEAGGAEGKTGPEGTGETGGTGSPSGTGGAPTGGAPTGAGAPTGVGSPGAPIPAPAPTGTGAIGSSGAAGAEGAAASGATAGGATAGAAAEGAAASGAAAGGASAGAAGGAAATAATPVGWIILIVIAVILLILMIIGIVVFVVDGVGIINEKMQKFADDVWEKILTAFVGGAEASVESKKDEILPNVANYLEQMGYNLENFGFLDSNGEALITEDFINSDGTGVRKLKRNDFFGTVVLERNIEEKNGQIVNGDITKIQSTCLYSYLVAQNRMYLNDKDISNASINWYVAYLHGMFPWLMIPLDALTSGATLPFIGDGMLSLDDSWFKGYDVEIDKENKQLRIKKDGNVYVYDLDGWTGRYGMPLEFSLTLHLATMAPEFVTDITSNKDVDGDGKVDFDTKVKIGMHPIDAEISLKVEEGDNLVPIESSSIYNDLSEETKKAIEDYCGTIKMYTPYIESVENHWFRDLIFDDCYIEDTYQNQGLSGEFNYEYKGLGEDNDLLKEIDGLYVCETREKDLFQIKEPKIKDTSAKIKNMLTGNDYYIYNGVALKGENAKRSRRTIIQEIAYEEDGTKKYTMDTKMFQYAFAILESVHTQDAEYILRDLKELFRDFGIDVDEEVKKNLEITPLEWLIPDYIPVVWDPMFNTQETSMTIKSSNGANKGFKEEQDIIMPANGKIEKIMTDDDGSQTIKISFDETDREDLLGMSLYIKGVKAEVTKGDIINAKEVIAKTIDKKDITVIMTDKLHSPIINVDSYIRPPEIEFEKEM